MDQDRTAAQPSIPEPPPAESAGGAAPVPAALTPAQEVGGILKATRVSRGYSLESVCQHTRIPRKFIEALEASRFDELPAPVYLRSFLEDYCEYLELELRPLWEKLHPSPAVAAPAAAQAEAATDPAAPRHRTPPAAAHGAAAVRQKPGADRSSASAPSPLQASPYFNALVSSLGAVVFSLSLALALAWWVMHGRPAGPASEAGLRPQALLPVRSAIEPKLVLVCRDENWVSVKADGVVLFAGRLPKNARQEFQAHRSLSLRSSAPEELILTLNGAPYRLPRPDDNGEFRIESL
jgi:hypothetical protein